MSTLSPGELADFSASVDKSLRKVWQKPTVAGDADAHQRVADAWDVAVEQGLTSLAGERALDAALAAVSVTGLLCLPVPLGVTRDVDEAANARVVEGAKQRGYVTLAWPPQYGGKGASIEQEIVLAEEFKYAESSSGTRLGEVKGLARIRCPPVHHMRGKCTMNETIDRRSV